MMKSKFIKTLECRKIYIQIQVHVRLRLWSFSFIGDAKDKEVYFLEQGWTRLVQMTEIEGEK